MGNPLTGTFTKSEDQGEMPHNAFVKVKKIFRQENTIFFESYKLSPLDMIMDYPKFIASSQKEESISTSMHCVRH